MYKQVFEQLCLMMSNLTVPVKVELLFQETGTEHGLCTVVVNGLAQSHIMMDYTDDTKEKVYRFVVNSMMMEWVDMRMKRNGIDIFKEPA